jgi:hypothetical protein
MISFPKVRAPLSRYLGIVDKFVTIQTLAVIASEAKQSSGSWIAAVATLPRNDGIPASV